MSIYYNSRKKLNPISEVEVVKDGKKVNLDDEDPDNKPGDYTTDGDDSGSEDPKPQDGDASSDDEPGEDYTAGSDDNGSEGDDDESSNEGDIGDGSEDSESEDYTIPDDDTDGGDPESDDSGEDYTAGSDGSEGDDDGSSIEGDGSDDGQDGSSDDSGDEGDTGEESIDERIKKMETELFSNLSQEEMEIKHKELKTLYMQLFDTTTSTIERINDITKTEQNMAIMTFAAQKITELRRLIMDYLTDVYKTKSLIENTINFNQYLAVLSGINKILGEVPKAND